MMMVICCVKKMMICGRHNKICFIFVVLAGQIIIWMLLMIGIIIWMLWIGSMVVGVHDAVGLLLLLLIHIVRAVVVVVYYCIAVD